MSVLRRVDQPDAPAHDERASYGARDWRDNIPAWVARLALALCALFALGIVVYTQVRLSAYAATGGGAAQIAAPPLLVAASLIASFIAALLLDANGVARAVGRLRAGLTWLLEVRHAPHTGWRFPTLHPPRLGNWRDMLPMLHTRDDAEPTGWTRAEWRGFVCFAGVATTLALSALADIYAIYPLYRPIAQWFWVGSVALLLLVAWVWGPRPNPPAPFPQVWEGGDAEGGDAEARSLAIGDTPAAPPRRRLRRLLPPLPTPVGRGWGLGLDALLLAILTLGSLALRLPGLLDTPYVVHGDEAACGLEALRWLHGGVPSLLSVGWYGLPVAGYGLPALVMLVTGPGLYGLRLSSVILGVAGIVLLYAFAREYVNRRVAFLAAALLAVSTIDIQFSRMGIHYIHAPFVVLLTLWALARSLRTGGVVSAVVVGVGLSLSLQVYFSARIVLLIVPCFLIGLAIFNRRALKGRLTAIGWMALSALVAIGPLAVYFYHDQAALKARAVEVLITTNDVWTHNHVITMFNTSNMRAILLRQFATIPLLPGGLTDQSLQYGPLYPMFDALIAALILIGFWYTLLHLTRPLCLLLFIWVVGVVTAGGALTIDMPWWPRLLVGVPAFCLLAAVALEATLRLVLRAAGGLATEWRVRRTERALREWLARAAWRGATRGPRPALASPYAPGWPTGRMLRAGALWLLALAVLVYSGVWSGYNYFHAYPTEVTASWRTQYTDIGRYLATQPQNSYVILYTDTSVIWTYSTFQFLEPQMQGIRATDPVSLVGDLVNLSRNTTMRNHPILIVITDSQASSFKSLTQTRGALPPGVFAAHTAPQSQGQIAFYTYAIPPG